MALVTIDFHNTLFRCDDWFRLEIESLPAAVIQHLKQELGDRDLEQLRFHGVDYYRGIRRRAMESGIECDAEASMYQVFDQLEIEIDRKRVRDSVAAVMWETVATARPRCGAVNLVRQLHERRTPLAVVSSAAYHPFLEWCLDRHGMRAAFQHVVTSASCGIYKSNPQIYQHTMDLFRSPPDSAVHIGDSHRFDVTSASAVGMRTILLSDDTELQVDPPPDAIIASLGDAEPHLDRLLGR